MLAGSALLVLGGSAPLGWRLLALLLALGVAALGLGTLGEYAFDWRLGIDELLPLDTGGRPDPQAGRMSPYSALAFGAIGLALAALPHQRLRTGVWFLSTSVAIVGIVILLGYARNGSDLANDLPLPMALHSALAFALLGFGALLRSGQRRVELGANGANGATRVSIEMRVFGSFVATFLLLLAGGSITYRTSAEFARLALLVAHTQNVRTGLSQLYATVADAEAAQRQYLLTGAPHFQRDFQRLADASQQQTRTLTDLVADNPAQGANLERLRVLTAAAPAGAGPELVATGVGRARSRPGPGFPATARCWRTRSAA